ncbi:MAG: hypothetical protein ACK4WB_09930 [Desulfatiglandales bacterium]
MNLEVDLLFFDTTSTYMEMDEEDNEGPSGMEAFQVHMGHGQGDEQ